jgi:MipA family protein
LNSRKLIFSFTLAGCAGLAHLSAAAADPGAPAGDTAVAPSSQGTAASASPRKKPLWELGLGVGGLYLPDYRGSDEHQGYLTPLPYVVYRGTWFKADREGTRAVLLDTERLTLDVSVGASPPTRTRDNGARSGMPKVPGTFELGPNLNVLMAASAREQWKLELRLPLRAAMTLESSPRYAGATFSPNLNLDIANVAGGWNVGMLTGPLFADAKNHGFFYNVDAPYATAQRPAYQSKGGYSGWRALVAASRRFGGTWVGAFARYDHLGGAAFEDSPLVRRSSAVTVGFGVAWFFAASSELVSADD